MPDTVAILREQTKALIGTEEIDQIVQSVTENSVALKMMTRLPNMGTNVREYPIMDNYPMAGFVEGDNGLKMTTNMKWSKKKFIAEEIAAIVAIPDNVIADSSYDVWGQVRPRLVEAAGRVIDKAIFFGIDKPESWRAGLVDSAIAAGNVVNDTGDLFKDIFDVNGLISKVEEDGYFPDGILSAIPMMARLRGLRDTTNRPLFLQNMQSTTPYTLNGMQLEFPRNGAFDPTKALMITGDFTQAVYAMRQDVTFDIFDSGVVSDSEGKVVFNLMQNDMKAIRMVLRMGWDIFNPLNALNEDETTRFPFAVYAPAKPGTGEEPGGGSEEDPGVVQTSAARKAAR